MFRSTSYFQHKQPIDSSKNAAKVNDLFTALKCVHIRKKYHTINNSITK